MYRYVVLGVEVEERVREGMRSSADVDSMFFVVVEDQRSSQSFWASSRLANGLVWERRSCGTAGCGCFLAFCFLGGSLDAICVVVDCRPRRVKIVLRTENGT